MKKPVFIFFCISSSILSSCNYFYKGKVIVTTSSVSGEKSYFPKTASARRVDGKEEFIITSRAQLSKGDTAYIEYLKVLGLN